MTHNALSERSIVLRLEFSIADAVHQRGLLAVLGAAISAWWNRPRLPPELPAHLRTDVGLLPDSDSPQWFDLPAHPILPPPLRRPGM
ncbi:hypothetical protein [Devosia epidermidihirudinis]|uniref:hypothetical protein n=1 Tax=Devosia epidermidihirudinis TaxID=1293439 RepID=UPI000B296937|nr:hypothetical protein [Devosia epidermidihirudinis]